MKKSPVDQIKTGAKYQHKQPEMYLIVITSVAFLAMTIKLFGLSYFWLGLLLSLLALLFYQIFLAPAFVLLNELTPTRLKLNLSLLGLEKPKVGFPFQLLTFWLSFFVVFVLALMSWSTVKTGFSQVVKIFQPEVLVLRIEYPAYSAKSAMDLKLDGKLEPIEVEIGSQIQVFAKNKRTTGKVKIETKMLPLSGTTPQESSKIVNSELSKEHAIWSVSTHLLLEKLYPESLNHRTDGQKWNTKSDADFKNPIDIEIKIIGDKTHAVPIKILPAPRPKVTLKVLGTANNVSLDEKPLSPSSALLLDIATKGEIPLAGMQLHVRTRSGLRFQKSVGEFAGSQQTEYTLSKYVFNLFGIPFQPNDSLYLKAVASTIVTEITGESEEIEIKIKTKADVRAQIVEALDQALEQLKSESNFEDVKQNAKKLLEEALQLAPMLGERHRANKSIPKALSELGAAQDKKDAHKAAAQKIIEETLASLRKQQKQEKAADLFSQLANLKHAASNSAAEQLPEMSTQAAKLGDEFQKLQQQIKEQVLEKNELLQPQEKQEALEAISRDKTSENLDKMAKHLQDKNMDSSLQSVNAASESAQKNLGLAMMILDMAQKRAIAEAKEKLTTADRQLENSKEKPQALKSSQDALSQFKKLPEISQDFDSSAKEAKSEISQVIKDALANNDKSRLEHTEKGQDAIVKALEALQDAEQERDESTGEAEQKKSRQEYDLLYSESVLDNSWRKNILEEISRLRASGLGPDDSVIKLLESRLR